MFSRTQNWSKRIAIFQMWSNETQAGDQRFRLGTIVYIVPEDCAGQ